MVSDHGYPSTRRDIDDLEKAKFINVFNALLMYKDFNSKGNIKVDTNFMTIADVPYLASKHIPNIKNVFNNKIITNDYKTNGAYILVLNENLPNDNIKSSYDFNYFYKVKDNIYNDSNWSKYKINWQNKNEIIENEFKFDTSWFK